MAARFEFRVFGVRLDAERAALERAAGPAGQEEERLDVYFVVPGRADASLKLRGEKLDLKLLRHEREGLELWEPAGETAFPVPPGELERLLGPAGVRLELPAPAPAPLDRERLLSLARAAPSLRVVRVEKRRRRFCVAGVAAEFTRVAAGGRPFESVAVEEADREKALAAVAALGLSGRRNTSYQRFLLELAFGAGDPAGSGGADTRRGGERPGQTR